MKYAVFATALAMAQQASAHYFFNQLIIDGRATRNDEFVLSNSRQAKYNPTKWAGLRDNATPDGPEMRCNLGAFESQPRTKIADVTAGAKLGFKVAVGAKMQHPGPASVYMSKAPTTVDKYQGDGDWFKVFETGVCDKSADFTRNAWCTYDKDIVEFTVPKDVPNGDYLVRVEHIGLHQAHFGQAEFYMSCAQVRITGGGNGKPGPMVKFPGAYKKDDPSFNFSIYNGFKPYPMPGPAVWTGGDATGAAAGNETSPVAQQEQPVKASASLPAASSPTAAATSAAATSAAPKPTSAASAPAAGQPTTTSAAPAQATSAAAGSTKPKCEKRARKARRHAKQLATAEDSE